MTDIKAVHGLLRFAEPYGDNDHWTEEEMAPIIAVMDEANEAMRRYFGCYPSEPQGTHVGWDLIKLSGQFGARYCAWLWTWEQGSYGGNTPQEIADQLRTYYAWVLNKAEAEGSEV